MKLKKKILLSGLIATFVFGITSSVYAKPDAVVTSLPKTVTRGALSYQIDGMGDTGPSLPFYNVSSDGNYYLYCSDRNNTARNDGDVLTQDERMDYSIAYIIEHGYPANKKVSTVIGKRASQPAGPSDIDFVAALNIYITQAAIWNVQGSLTEAIMKNNSLIKVNSVDPNVQWSYALCKEDNNSCITAEATDAIKYSGANVWNDYVKGLVAEAKAAKDPADTTLSMNKVNSWTEENNQYKSDLITVSSSNANVKIANYALELSNAPQGTKVYTEAGNDITGSLTNIPWGTKIYITVPTSEVSNGKANFNLNAKASITYNAAYKYVDKVKSGGVEKQPSVLVGPETKEISGALPLTIVPDTASMISKSIYLIGFIILISGAGIIYANVRPKKQETE